MDFLKDIVATRGVQLASRYIGMGLISLTTYLHASVSADDDTKVASVLASLIGSAICFAIDHFSHAQQQSK